MTKSERRWLLTSTATPKGACLRRLVEAMPDLDVQIRQQAPQIEIVEQNHLRKSPHLYSHKAHHLWSAMKDQLLPNEVGIATDTHPKVQDTFDGGFSNPLVKYPRDLGKATLEERKKKLSRYIAQNMSKYQEHVIIRQGIGVIPWVSGGLIGLISQKIYIHYPKNPLPDIAAAADYLEFCRTNYPGNTELEVSSVVAGAIMQPQLVMWAVQELGMEVQIDAVETDPLRELEDAAYGFSRPIVRALDGVTRKMNSLQRTWKGEKKKSQIPFWPSRSSKLVWSQGDQKVVVAESWQ